MVGSQGNWYQDTPLLHYIPLSCALCQVVKNNASLVFKQTTQTKKVDNLVLTFRDTAGLGHIL